jgi:hypothetical protein
MYSSNGVARLGYGVWHGVLRIAIKGLFQMQGRASRLEYILDAALRQETKASFFSRSPTVRYLVITGDVDF